MTAVITHSVSAGGTVDATAAVDGAAWDANHVITGVMTPSQGGTGVINNDNSTITISGSFGATFTLSATTSVTFPTTGTLATLAGAEALTNKTYNGNTWTAGTGVLTIAAAKTLTNSNTLTLTATDGSTAAFGAGGTVAYSSNFGTGVSTALGVNVGTAGAFVVNGGAGGTPSSLTATNVTGLPLSGHTNQAAYTLVVNNTAGLAAPTAVDIPTFATKAIPTISDWLLISDQAASGALKKAAFPVGGSGTVTSVTVDGLAITGTGTAPPRFGYANATIAVSAASSALTIALKDNAGSDPSATSPAAFWFRNVTGTTGSWSQVSATAAMSLVLSSGSTMGVTSSTAFRLWVVMFNDGGTLRLGAINCAAVTSTTANIYALSPAIPASSTAEGGAGAADSAGVFYTGTAVASKSFVVLGYVEWNATGLTAGTWTTTNLNFIQSFGPDVRLPGSVVQVVCFNNATQVSSTSNTYTASNLGTNITPTSAANMVRFQFSGVAYNRATTNAVTMFCAMHRGSTLVGPVSEAWGQSQQAECVVSGMYYDNPNTTSSTLYAFKFKNSDATTNCSFPATGTTDVAVMTLEEIMT